MTAAHGVTMEVTPAAEKFIRRMMRCSGGPTSGFRLKVRPGGCSGPAVEFDLADKPGKDEIVWEQAGLRLFLDSASCLLVNGAILNFIETRSMTGFVVTGPGGAAQSCSSSSSTFLPVDVLVRR